MKMVIHSSVLKNARKQRGLTQLDLSKETGISNAWISKIEKGQAVNVRLPTLHAICHALHIKTSDAFTIVE